MDFKPLRVRYLVAMGLLLDGGLLDACATSTPPTASAPESPTGVASTPPAADPAPPTSATTLTSTSASPAPSHSTTAAVASASTAPSAVVTHSMPQCARGVTCLPPPAGSPKHPARAPYAMCEFEVPLRDDSWPAGAPEREVTSILDTAKTTEARAAGKASCCYHWLQSCPPKPGEEPHFLGGGRALFVDGAPVTTRAVRLASAAPVGIDLPVDALAPSLRETIGARWAAEAGAEHASIASFARTSLALMALGAPAQLIAETHAAAIDEVRHAEVGYAIASAYAGHRIGPAPLVATSTATPEITAFAVETLRAACAGESVAAVIVRLSARAATHPALAEALDAIADDEDRHATLAWRTLAWAVETGGVATRAALEIEIDRLAAARTVADDPEVDAIDVSSHGLLGKADRRATQRALLREVVVPCARALLAAHRAQA